MKPSPFCLSRFVILLLALSLATPTAMARQSGAAAKPAPSLSKSEREASARIKVETRGTGQPGADKAARYIADRFTKIGLKPAGDAGTYLQAIKFKSEQIENNSSFRA